MNIYENGKIYKLVSNMTDEIYIGSSVRELSERFRRHKTKNNNCVSRNLFVEGAEVKIELLEPFPCKSKNELKARELHYIKIMPCINKKKPYVSELKGGTAEYNAEYCAEYYRENAEKKAEYYQNNAEKKAEYYKIYYQNNADKILERIKIYQENNGEKIAEQKKIYRENNAEKVKERRREYYKLHKK